MSILNAATGLLGSIPSPITTGLSVAGQIFGAVKGAKENQKNQQLLNKQFNENETDYNLSGQQSFLDTNVAKNQVKKLDENLRDANKAAAGRAAITGASDEAIVAANTGAQKNYNDAISGLAGQATQYQDSQKRMYLGRKDRLNGIQMGINQQKAENASSLVGNASDLFSTVTFNSGMKGDKPAVNNFGRTDSQQKQLKDIANAAK